MWINHVVARNRRMPARATRRASARAHRTVTAMGRRESPLHGTSPARLALAAALREARRQAGSPPYADLARTADYSATWLSKAASGTELPSWEVTAAYATACGVDPETLRSRWQAAAAETYNIGSAPDPTAITTHQQLAEALQALMRLRGLTSLRALESQTKKIAPGRPLSRSTLGRILSGQQMPSTEALSTFVRACGESATAQQRWLAARRRILTGSEANLVLLPTTGTANTDLAADVRRELSLLARGRGLAAPQLNISPRLRQLVAAAPDDPTHVVREKLTTAVIDAVTDLPEDLRLVAELAFNLRTESTSKSPARPALSSQWARFLAARLDWCAQTIERDTRTVRRRFDEVKIAIANRLLAEHAQRDQRSSATRAQG